jgi:hypothetical protein
MNTCTLLLVTSQGLSSQKQQVPLHGPHGGSAEQVAGCFLSLRQRLRTGTDMFNQVSLLDEVAIPPRASTFCAFPCQPSSLPDVKDVCYGDLWLHQIWQIC